jgi:hypothetical protein
MPRHTTRGPALSHALSLVVLGAAGAPTLAGPQFRVHFERAARETPASGRLVVYLVQANSGVDRSGQEPSEGPFFEDPQPMFAIDVKDLAPGAVAVVDDRATSFPVKLGELPEGRYKVQAVLDMHRADSSWKREPGNLYSKMGVFEVKKGAGSNRDEKVDIELTQVVKVKEPAPGRGVEYVEVPSLLLTKFRGEPVTLKAGVVLPTGYQAGGSKKYAAVYEIPGFGGDHRDARRSAMMYRGGAGEELLKNCFWIVLNPEGPNGHHLFANSDNNGPVGDALVQELIPELEKRFPLLSEQPARLLRGHSSGGWSTVWLAITYPETFGAAWSSSPDPVDFQHFQLPNIYADASMYTRPGASAAGGGGGGGGEVPSYRDSGDTRMTIRQENRMEEVLGPRNTSGQQWDSWLAVFGPRDKDGNPGALYDPQTGALDHEVAVHYRRYDIADLLRRDPAKYAPIFKQRIRLLCGTEDSYYLNEAVAALKVDLDKIKDLRLPEGEHGYVKLVPGKDHGTIFATPEMRAVPGEMLEHLKRAGYVK